MSNVLDLKDQQPGVAPAEVASAEVVDDLPEAILASTDIPTSVAWTAHHPLLGEARKRHFLFSVGIVVLGLLLSIWQGSPVAFFVLLLGAGVLELREHMSTPTSIAIDERGIHIDEQRYSHASFSSFHIHRMPDETLELSLKSEQRFLPHLRLPLGTQDPQKLHAVLSHYIPEGEHKIPYVDYYIRKPR